MRVLFNFSLGDSQKISFPSLIEPNFSGKSMLKFPKGFVYEFEEEG